MTPPTLLTPARVARLLGVSLSFVYKHFPSADFGRGTIPASALLDFLNDHRSTNMPEIKELVPLLGEQEAGDLIDVDGAPASIRHVRRFARRRVFPIPCFDLSPTCVRFPHGAVQWWLSYLDSPIPVRARVYHLGAPARSSTFRTHGAGSGRVLATSRA